jgi:hypothetical protein
VYIQTGAFFHSMSNDREVRVLELATTCPDCAGPFRATASMRQIKTRQLVRRCPACRKIRTGPVSLAAPIPRKGAKKKTSGRNARSATRQPAIREFEPPARITLLEVRPADALPGETLAAALQRALARVLDEPAGPPEELAQRQWRDALGMID